MKSTAVKPNEYLPFYMNYIALCQDLELIEGLDKSGKEVVDFYSKIPKNKLLYQYEQDKWTIKEILVHLIDCERIFCYRSLCIARLDKTDLPGFDQNVYATNSDANSKDITTLINDYKLQRQSTIALFKSFSTEMLMSIGRANSGEVSVRANGFIIIGHEKHHIKIIDERYLD